MYGRIFGRLGRMEDPNETHGCLSSAFFCAVVLFSAAALPARAQSHELLQGTQVHLRLLTGLSTAVAKSGDPFIAEVTQPVYVGTQMILPSRSAACTARSAE